MAEILQVKYPKFCTISTLLEEIKYCLKRNCQGNCTKTDQKEYWIWLVDGWSET